MPHIRVIIQSRLSSTRLPAKVLLPIAGYPAVVLCALRAANTGLEVIVATSTDPTDDPLALILQKVGIAYIRGSLNDVLGRFILATSDLASDDFVVRLTADNLVPDGQFIMEVITAMQTKQLKYIGTNSPLDRLPYGLSAEAFTVGALREAATNAMTAYDHEHVTPWIRRHYEQELFPIKSLAKDLSHLRCTIDSLSDYGRMIQLFNHTVDPVHVPWQDLIAVLTELPDEPNCRVPYYFKKNNLQSELILGTVQFGISYGAANQKGMPSSTEVTEMIHLAISYGVTTLDTARGYGEAETRIGSALKSGWAERVRVITKLDPLSFLSPDEDERNVISAVEASIFRSCCELGMHSLATVLLHRWSHYRKFNGAIWKRLLELKTEGYIQSLGVSVQTPQEGLEALADPDIEYIQLPFNVLDWRWKAAGFDQKALQRNDIIIYARSAYLQGILVSGPEVWPQVPTVNSGEWLRKIDLLVRETKRESRNDLCLAYVRAQKWIDSVVIGMEAVEQLLHNIRLFQDSPLNREEVELVDKVLVGAPENLLNPAKWKIK